MARDKRNVPPTQLTRKWQEQDVNGLGGLERHGVRMPNDFSDWSKLSGNVKEYTLSKEELAAYNEKGK
jgi:hypothetical protein